jgi:putative DNA primase/helicase
MALSIEDVLKQIRDHGIEPPAGLVADGKKFTWAGTPGKPKKKNAWAILHEWKGPKTQKTYVVGVYGCGDQSNFFKVEPTEVEWSPAEKTAWLDRKKAIDKEAEEERRLLADAASSKAEKLWARAQDNGVSPYLQRKQIGAHGIRFSFGKLLVPLCDAAGKLRGLQWVSEDGSKVFGTGTVKEGHFHLIGAVAAGVPLAFAEGYATAASVHMATGWPVVVCFDAGNLMPVVATFRKLYERHEFIVAGDDDRHLVARLCERLEVHGVAAAPKDFARASGGVRDMYWGLPDGRKVDLKAAWAKDRNDVYFIQGAITVDGVAKMLRLENAGQAKGMAVAKKHGARLLLPRFTERGNRFSDWNDLHCAEGIDAVREQLTATPEVEQKPNKKNGPSSDDGRPNNGGGGDDGQGPIRLHFPYRDDKHNIKGIRENVYFALNCDPALEGLVRLNEFSHRLDKTRAAPWGGAAGKWSELDDLRLANYLAEAHNLIVGNPMTVQQAVKMAAADRAYNPMQDYFNDLVWDGVVRRKHWMVDVLGAEACEYTEKVGTYFLLSMVARVFEPGCQMDYMLVLQGAQGARKSSVLKILAGEYYAGGTFRIGDKDSMQVLQGRLLFNFNEMDSMGKAESTAVKSFVTERVDVFRAPYAQTFSEFPRNCVLTGDTNQDDFLKDATGDRRSWVVHCGDIDPQIMAQQRDQLFAEAVHFYRLGEQRYPDKEEEKRLFVPQQERWKFVDVWQDALAKYVNSSQTTEGFDGNNKNGSVQECCEREFFSTQELLTKALNQDIAKVDRAGSQQRAVGNAMKALGFSKFKWTKGRARPWGYIRVLEKEEKAATAGFTPALAGNAVEDVPAWD